MGNVPGERQRGGEEVVSAGGDPRGWSFQREKRLVEICRVQGMAGVERRSKDGWGDARHSRQGGSWFVKVGLVVAGWDWMVKMRNKAFCRGVIWQVCRGLDSPVRV